MEAAHVLGREHGRKRVAAFQLFIPSALLGFFPAMAMAATTDEHVIKRLEQPRAPALHGVLLFPRPDGSFLRQVLCLRGVLRQTERKTIEAIQIVSQDIL